MNPTPKISCHLIVRNESAGLEALLKSLKPHVDELVVVDTGSEDSTPEIARKYADKFDIFLDANDSEGRIYDFSLARNHALSLCSHDWVLWVDGDDEVHGLESLRELTAMPDRDNLILMARYDYSPNTVQWRERLVYPRHRFHWEGRVHESLVPTHPIEGSIETRQVDSFLVKHTWRPERPRENERNLRILREVHQENPNDLRTLFYLGLELAARQQFPEAIHHLKKYVARSDFDDERAVALMTLAKIYNGLGLYTDAIQWALEASLERQWPEPFWLLGKTYSALAHAGTNRAKNFRRAAFFINLGLSIPPNDTALMNDPTEARTIHSWLHVALNESGNPEGALQSAEAGLALNPGDEELKANIRTYKSELAKRRIQRDSQDLLALGAIDPQTDAFVRNAVKGGITLTPVGSGDVSPVPSTSPEPGGLDIVFFAGRGLEVWTPKTVEERGMGGSETMLWELAKRLRKLGHRVRVFGHTTPSDEGIYEGVEWFDAHRFGNITCDVLISSRMPAAFDVPGVEAKARLLWVHDIHCGDALTFERDSKIDRYLVLSQWHREFFLKVYPNTNPNKVHVTRNGIDVEAFGPLGERDPHKLIYSSSPDRGLQTLLDVMPEIRARVPDATLEIFYGFENWKKSIEILGDRAQLSTVRQLEHQIKHTEGVTAHGMVSKAELRKAMLGAGVWGYPTWFQETSCISAMEALASGLHVVTSPIAALNETVGPYGTMIEGDWRSPEYKAAFTKAVVDWMTSVWPQEERVRNHAHAIEAFGLDPLAEEWSVMLRGLLGEIEENPVGAYFEPRVA